jgi:hypothetical protein
MKTLNPPPTSDDSFLEYLIKYEDTSMHDIEGSDSVLLIINKLVINYLKINKSVIIPLQFLKPEDTGKLIMNKLELCSDELLTYLFDDVELFRMEVNLINELSIKEKITGLISCITKKIKIF